MRFAPCSAPVVDLAHIVGQLFPKRLKRADMPHQVLREGMTHRHKCARIGRGHAVGFLPFNGSNGRKLFSECVGRYASPHRFLVKHEVYNADYFGNLAVVEAVSLVIRRSVARIDFSAFLKSRHRPH